MSKKLDEEFFEVGDRVTIRCEMLQMRNGVRENAIVSLDHEEVGRGTYYWSNRPWQCFRYASAIKSALSDIKQFTQEQRDAIYEGLKQRDTERVNAMFGSVAGVAKLGEIMCEDQKSKNDWKARMLKAGLPGLHIPDDWDELTEDEKTKRLDKVIALAKGVGA